LLQLCYAVRADPVFFIAHQHTDAQIDIANLSVRLSVRLSVTFRYQMKTA